MTDGIAGTVTHAPHPPVPGDHRPLTNCLYHRCRRRQRIGKTTFTNAIRQIFGPDLVATITLDDYHKYDREERKRLDITPLHPDANNLAQY